MAGPAPVTRHVLAATPISAAAVLRFSVGPDSPWDGGQTGPTPSSCDCKSSCPRPALTRGRTCSQHKASPRGNSRSMWSVQPVDKASSISILQVDDFGRASEGSHRSCLTEGIHPVAHRSNLHSLHLISFFPHSVSFYPFITSAPLDYLPVTFPAPRSLSQTF